MDMICLPRGVALRGYERPAEDAYFVSEGCITVGWEEAGHVEERLGPKAIFNPAGRAHYFRNDGVADAEFILLYFSPQATRARGLARNGRWIPNVPKLELQPAQIARAV